MNVRGFARRFGNTAFGLHLRRTTAGRMVEGALRRSLGWAAIGGADPTAYAKRMGYLSACHDLPIDTTMVLYEAFDGAGVLDNPRAIFEHLLRDDRYRHLHHVWAVRSDATPARPPASAAARVSYVLRGSQEYFKALSTAKYLINNATFPAEFAKRPGQIYLNTWHGVPLKHMGYDMRGGYSGSKNVLRNLVSADYLVSAGPFMTNTMYRNAFRLDGVFPGEILEVGQPRVDEQISGDDDSIARALQDGGLVLDGRKVILYAPTWRGTSISRPQYDIEEIQQVLAALESAVDPAEYRILVKVHQYVARTAPPELADIIVSAQLPTNALLARTDILITDYSSILFDFLPTGRPIVFHGPDIDSYSGTRGMYADPADFPGDVTRNVDELAAAVRAAIADPDAHSARREQWRESYCPYDDGGATRRVVDIVFGESRGPAGAGEGRRVRLRTDKRKVLIYAGGLRPNGITSSLMALLNNVDYTKVDVSIFYDSPKYKFQSQNAAKVPREVRHFPRVGGMIQRQNDVVGRNALQSTGLDIPDTMLAIQRRNFSLEWRRCFGDATFDHIIDFSGYASFWSFLCLQGAPAQRSIWIHSDLSREVENEGRQAQTSTLPAVFTMLGEFDHVVAVSPAVRDLVVRKLADYVVPDRVTVVRNLLDLENIRHSAGFDDEAAPAARIEASTLPGRSDHLSGLELQLMGLGRDYGWDALRTTFARATLRHRFFPLDRKTVTFITAGRLSPEKNHERLIRAFEQVHRRHPEARLVICGEGPLRADLESLVRSLGLGEACSLPGHVNGVSALISRADGFVLSSDYEGQPVVLLESLALGTPIVTTRFETVAGVIPDGQGTIVEPSVDALAGGMLGIVDGTAPAPSFDADAYNRAARGEFMRLVGRRPQEAAAAIESTPVGARLSV